MENKHVLVKDGLPSILYFKNKEQMDAAIRKDAKIDAAD